MEMMGFVVFPFRGGVRGISTRALGYETGNVAERVFWSEEEAPWVEGTTVKVQSGEEIGHLRSRRVKEGGKLVLFDGYGGVARGVLKEWGVRGKTVKVYVESVERNQSRLGGAKVTMAVAMPKGNRADTVVEKLTELGVGEIVPVEAERSVVGEVEERKKGERWRRVSIAACKQSLREVLPVISERWWGVAEVAERIQEEGDKVMAMVASGGGESILEVARRWEEGDGTGLLCVVGPEGGFTDEEERDLVESGAVPVSLGSTRLRVETAAIVSASVLAMCARAGRSEPRT